MQHAENREQISVRDTGSDTIKMTGGSTPNFPAHPARSDRVTRLQLSMLGSPEIRLGGASVSSFESDKVRALLFYLAVESDHASSRGALANLLWPEYSERRARHNLSQAIFNLRHSLNDYKADPPFLLIRRKSLQFNTESDHRSDVHIFVNQAKRAADCHDIQLMEATAALYTGAFLAGFPPIGADSFEAWLRERREWLHRVAYKLIGQILDWHEDRRAFALALPHAQRMVALDPRREEGQRRLIRLLALTGNRSEALVQYETCRRILAEELDIQPGAETLALIARVRDDQAIDAPPDGSSPIFLGEQFLKPSRFAQQMQTDDHVCVGREGQLTQLRAALNSAVADGSPRIVFVTGGAGQGKTTLLREFGRRAQTEFPRLAVAVGQGAAYTGQGDIYAPFRSILEQLAGGSADTWHFGNPAETARRRKELTKLSVPTIVEQGPDLIGTLLSAPELLARVQENLPLEEGSKPAWLCKLQQAVPDLRPKTDQRRVEQLALFEQTSRVIQALARSVPLLLVLDDLQWADPGSIGLLFHLGRAVSSHPILIVGAYRAEELGPAADGSRHPLAGVVHELQQTFGADLIALGEQPDWAFVDELIDHEPNLLDGDFRTRLFRQSGGHPLFTVELLRSMAESGDIDRDSQGRWVAHDAIGWDRLPPRVEAAIAERIERLPAAWRRLLQIACVQGDRFVAEIVAEVADADIHTVLQSLSEGLGRQQRLVMARMSTVAGSHARRRSMYRFRHHLSRQYLYEQLDPVERSLLHEATAHALEQSIGDSATDAAAQLAWHFEEAGLPMQAARYLHAASVAAVRKAATHQGIARLKRGIELIASEPDSEPRSLLELELQLALGAALNVEAGHASPEVMAAFARARSLADQVGAADRLILALWNAKSFHDLRAEYRAAMAIGRQLLDIAEESGQDSWRLIAHSTVGYTQMYMGELQSAREHLERGVALYDPDRHTTLAEHHGQDPGITCLMWAAITLWIAGEAAQARRASVRVLALAERLAQPYALAYVHMMHTILSYLKRDVAAVEAHAQRTRALAAEHGYSLLHAGAGPFAVWASFRRGEASYEAACNRFEERVRRFLATGAHVDLPILHSLLADIHAQSGVWTAALAEIELALGLCHKRHERYFEPELHRMRGEYLLQEDESHRQEAEACFEQAVALARTQQARSWERRAANSLYKHFGVTDRVRGVRLRHRPE